MFHAFRTSPLNVVILLGQEYVLQEEGRSPPGIRWISTRRLMPFLWACPLRVFSFSSKDPLLSGPFFNHSSSHKLPLRHLTCDIKRYILSSLALGLPYRLLAQQLRWLGRSSGFIQEFCSLIYPKRNCSSQDFRKLTFVYNELRKDTIGSYDTIIHDHRKPG